MSNLKKSILSVFIVTTLMFLFTSCGNNEITLDLSFGERTGKYTGEMENDLPNGMGEFVTTNPEGFTWTYEGNFKDGHFDGEGQQTWESGFIRKGTYKNDVLVPISKNKLKQLYSDPISLRGNCVELIGEVFMSPEYYDGGVCIQMLTDMVNRENNTVIYINDENFEVSEGDFVKITGIVEGKIEGTNAYGTVISTPGITADEYEIIDPIEALSPTVKAVDVNETQQQLGYSVTLQKIEFAENETRFYIKVDNNGRNEFSLYSFNAKVVQDAKQYEDQRNRHIDYPEIQTQLLPGTSSEGIIAFPKLDSEKEINIILDCKTYHERLNNYVFKIK